MKENCCIKKGRQGTVSSSSQNDHVLRYKFEKIILKKTKKVLTNGADCGNIQKLSRETAARHLENYIVQPKNTSQLIQVILEQQETQLIETTKRKEKEPDSESCDRLNSRV